MTKDKKPDTTEQEMQTQYIIAQVSRSVEDRIDTRVRKSLTLVQVMILVVIAVLGPAAWYGVQNVIGVAIENISKKIYTDLDKTREQVQSEILEIKQEINYELLYLRIANGTFILNQRIDVGSKEIDALVDGFVELAKHKDIISRAGFPIILEDAVRVLIRYGYQTKLNQLEKIFPAIIRENSAINRQLLSFYAHKILSTTDLTTIKDSPSFQRYKKYLQIISFNKLEEYSLPVEMLVEFHLANNKRTPTVDKLLDSAMQLEFSERAILIWEIMKNTDPGYWQRKPKPSDYRISNIAALFMEQYHSQMFRLANSTGVKEALLALYRVAKTSEDIRLGAHIMYYFYKIPVT